MTKEEVKTKAAEIATRLGCKVIPIMVTDSEGNQIVAYFKQPNFASIMYSQECILSDKDKLKGAEHLLTFIIDEESDPAYKSDDLLRASLMFAIFKAIKPYDDELKKN